MPTQPLSPEDRQYLLQLARQTITRLLAGETLPVLELDCIPAALREPGASFVTLTRGGELRGCVGALEAYQSLAEDVIEHAAAAAFEDYRFPPLETEELDDLHIEISYLTQPIPLPYHTPEDLIHCLRPNVDGVLIRDGIQRATFLPQVWEKIPDPESFLSQLCLKMGAAYDLWRRKPLQVFIYQVESFEEKPTHEEGRSPATRE